MLQDFGRDQSDVLKLNNQPHFRNQATGCLK